MRKSKKRVRARDIVGPHDFPNPVAVKLIEDAVQYAVDEPAPPGLEPLRESLRDLLPMALLATAATLTPATGSISINGEPDVPIRKIDIQTAFFSLMAKTMAPMIGKAANKMKLFDLSLTSTEPVAVPPTSGASQGGSEKTSRRKGRRKTTAKKR